METINTLFYGKGVAAETIWQALTALAEGLDIRATARVFGVDPNTVQSWLHQAAVHLAAVTAYLRHDLHLSQVQVDELWALLGQTPLRAGNGGSGQTAGQTLGVGGHRPGQQADDRLGGRRPFLGLCPRLDPSDRSALGPRLSAVVSQ
jgi:hypothetical protein